MVLTVALKKNILEKIVKQTFLNFGNIIASQMLDSLKAFGFFYATSSGISIGLEDLKSPEGKKKIKENSNEYIASINKKYITGFISDSERFQDILNHWFLVTEKIKKEILDYYKNYDPANSLYIMAFSGARGNISQVQQIVGLRGLMTDQAGNVISFPIKNNFKEGLTSVDYLVSAYGARKGVVDTALKTAVAGYLTRRLIFLAQDVIIRQLDCKSKKGLIIDISKNSNCNNLIGRYLNSVCNYSNNSLKFIPSLSNQILTKKLAQFLVTQKNKNLFLNIRSPLTCQDVTSLCQKCYGWDLGKGNNISLGEAVGIIAAQSIGEPGTQLTMRTFHTGGVFGGKLTSTFFSLPLSGKVLFYQNFDGIYNRGSFGENIFKLTKNLKIEIFHWKKGLNNFYISKNYDFFLQKNNFIKKNEKLANQISAKILANKGIKKLIPIYSEIDGEIFKEQLIYKKLYKNANLILNNSKISVALGKFQNFHIKTKYRNLSVFNKNKSIAFLNILVAPESGLLIKNTDFIFFYTKNLKYIFDIKNSKILNNFILPKNNFSELKNILYFFSENYQFIDKGTICGRVETFAQKFENIFKINHIRRPKILKKTLFYIRAKDIFSLNIENLINSKIKLKIGDIINLNDKFKIPLKVKLLKKDGCFYIFQLIQSFFLPKGALFYKKNHKFISKEELISHGIIYQHQANDIVQGLPKINELIEASTLKDFNDEILFSNASLFFNLKNVNIFLKNKEYLKKKKFINSYLLFFQKNNKNANFFLFQKENSFLSFKNFFNSNNKNSFFFLQKNYKTKEFKIELSLKQKISLKKETPFSIYQLNNNDNTFFIQNKFFTFFQLAEEIKRNNINPHTLLFSFYSYYLKKNISTIEAALYSFQKLQLIIINSIQSIYYHQGVNISTKHIELIIRQLTNKIFIINYSSQNFLKNEFAYISILKIYKKTIDLFLESFEKNLFTLSNINNLNKNLLKTITNIEEELKNFKITPTYFGSTKNALLKQNGFLASASFQQTRKNLIQAGISGSKDWIIGLQESIITNKLLPSGSGYLFNKNYLDTIYSYKAKNYDKY